MLKVHSTLLFIDYQHCDGTEVQGIGQIWLQCDLENPVCYPRGDFL